MVIGVLKIKLSMDGVSSLKEKRHIVKSIIERIKSRFNASVAEVDLNDIWKSTIVGVACVSNETAHVDSILSNIVNFVENEGRAVLVDYSTEIIHV
ncbi:MAG TPA: DUF503 domain-containing protein [Clostridiaceae bacterium]|jgi:uncharacterized protein YlxP (DUF503 family)|nr:DUF503 domain-containing protein [Clostridiaceae bacterium]